jgi:hypothetical protein
MIRGGLLTAQAASPRNAFRRAVARAITTLPFPLSRLVTMLFIIQYLRKGRLAITGDHEIVSPSRLERCGNLTQRPQSAQNEQSELMERKLGPYRLPRVNDVRALRMTDKVQR